MDQAKFFNASISDAIRLGARDILVCGTSDTAMPSMVLSIAAQLAIPVRLFILDLCPTPGQLARRHIDPQASTLQVETCDVLRWNLTYGFDLIVTHSLLGQFSDKNRLTLFQKWRDLLRPSGSVITVNRVRKLDGVRSFDTDTAQALADEAVRRYHHYGLPAQFSPEDLHHSVIDYCRDRSSRPVKSKEVISRLCVESGLEIVSLRTETSDTRTTGVNGPAMPDGASYCHLVARKSIRPQDHL